MAAKKAKESEIAMRIADKYDEPEAKGPLYRTAELLNRAGNIARAAGTVKFTARSFGQIVHGWNTLVDIVLEQGQRLAEIDPDLQNGDDD